MKNQDNRRWELILKQIAGTLTPVEGDELALLQKAAMEKTRLNSYGNKARFYEDEDR